jgi:electron transport complex protein RnfE
MTPTADITLDSSRAGPGYGRILRDGLWWNHPGLAQLLGLCPLLAVSRSAAAGLGLGLATLFVLTATNGLVAALRRWIDARVRLPSLVLVMAGFVTAVDQVFKAAWFDLYLDVGLFVPLIVTNCLILARAETFASRSPVLPALADGMAHGLGFALLLVAMGLIRETLGTGLLIALLPPGALFLLGLLVALRNAWLARQAPAPALPATTGAGKH